MISARNWSGATSSKLAAAAFLLLASVAAAAPVLPEGSTVEPQPDLYPAQRLAAEIAGGRQSFLVALGNTAFSSPLLYGAAARAAGLTCNGCHVNGHVNPAFFVPGHSTRPGNFDTTSALFNPRADNGLLDPVDIPSLRGVRFLGPWGRDGRIGSLREFVRHVIVDEFGGPEPEPLILDALTAYLNEQEFLPNPRLDSLGQLTGGASTAERRGEALFRKEFAGLNGLACASCHQPQAAFTDGRTHDVGTGGRYKTPTLLDADSSAPYFHDGAAPDYAAVVAHFDRTFVLDLSAAERDDLVAYLNAVGDAEDAEEPPGFSREMSELAIWTGLLETTIAADDAKLTRFVAETVAADLGRIERAWPDGDRRGVQRPDRQKQPVDYAALRRRITAVAGAMDAGRPEAARAELAAYIALAESMTSNYPHAAR